MGRAQKYALIQNEVLYWALMAVVVYLIATKFSLVAALGIALFQVVAYSVVVAKVRRDRRKDR